MRRAAPFLAALCLAACSTGELPPLASFDVAGDYREVATCLRSQLAATERNMVYVDDREHARALLWEDRESGSGTGSRRFDLAIVQAAPAMVRVDLRRAGQTRADQDRFAARLEQALGGCRSKP